MTPGHLNALPVELFGFVVSFLDLEDVASLRLSCRDSASKATQGKFTAAVRQRKIRLTTKTLTNLVAVTKDSRYVTAHILDDCTLVGVVDDWQSSNRSRVSRSVSSGGQNGETIAQHTRLLTQAFRNLQKHTGNNGRLTSLHLRTVIRKDDGSFIEPGTKGGQTAVIWRAAWGTARRTFRVVMGALAASGLCVDSELDLFHGQVIYNLSCDLLVLSVDTFPWPAIFGSLKRLKANVSSPVDDYRTEPDTSTKERETRKEWDTLYRMAGGRLKGVCLQTLSIQVTQRLLQGLVRLLHLLPALNEMDICWRPAEVFLWRRVLQYRQKLRHPTTLPVPVIPPLLTAPEHGYSRGSRRLQVLTLSGFNISAANLLQFLRTSQPTTLTLRSVSLVRPDTYAEFFDFITARDTPISSFYLDDLLEAEELISFDDPGPPKFPHVDGQGAPSTLSRKGEDTKLAISYHLSTSKVRRSAKYWIWWYGTLRHCRCK